MCRMPDNDHHRIFPSVCFYYSRKDQRHFFIPPYCFNFFFYKYFVFLFFRRLPPIDLILVFVVLKPICYACRPLKLAGVTPPFRRVFCQERDGRTSRPQDDRDRRRMINEPLRPRERCVLFENNVSLINLHHVNVAHRASLTGKCA